MQQGLLCQASPASAGCPFLLLPSAKEQFSGMLRRVWNLSSWTQLGRLDVGCLACGEGPMAQAFQQPPIHLSFVSLLQEDESPRSMLEEMGLA